MAEILQKQMRLGLKVHTQIQEQMTLLVMELYLCIDGETSKMQQPIIMKY